MFDKLEIRENNIYMNGIDTKINISNGYDFHTKMDLLYKNKTQLIHKYDMILENILNGQNINKGVFDDVIHSIYDIDNQILECYSEYEILNKDNFAKRNIIHNKINQLKKQISDIEQNQYNYHTKHDDIKRIVENKKEILELTKDISNIHILEYIGDKYDYIKLSGNNLTSTKNKTKSYVSSDIISPKQLKYKKSKVKNIIKENKKHINA